MFLFQISPCPKSFLVRVWRQIFSDLLDLPLLTGWLNATTSASSHTCTPLTTHNNHDCDCATNNNVDDDGDGTTGDGDDNDGDGTTGDKVGNDGNSVTDNKVDNDGDGARGYDDDDDGNELC